MSDAPDTGCFACGYRTQTARGYVCEHPVNQVIQFFRGTGPYLNEQAMPNGCERQHPVARRAPKMYLRDWFALHDHDPEDAQHPLNEALSDGSLPTDEPSLFNADETEDPAGGAG